jgi:hypothetical protein
MPYIVSWFVILYICLILAYVIVTVLFVTGSVYIYLYSRVLKVYEGVSKSFRTERNKQHLLRSNAKGYGGKTHETDSQNSDTTAPGGRELYHLQFSFQAASPETFVYSLVCHLILSNSFT